jgi:peptidoglycan L-alanyl-D-glutamate endopeptidase CwlK
MDAISEERLSLVLPGLADKIRTMAEMLSLEGIEIRVTQGLRTWAEQAALYAQGRTAPGSVVTNAQPGYSWHNFGLAVDVAPFDGGVPEWNTSQPAWGRIIAIGESLGLFSGDEFHAIKDEPHFQLTGQLPVSPDDSVRAEFQSGGIEAVWTSTLLDA